MSLPAFWVTHIAKALSGEQSCQLATWLGGRMKFEKSTEKEGALATWRANHSALLQATADQLRREGWKLDVERFFRVTGQHAEIAGKADLIAQKPECRPRILDAKSGTPKDTDVSQVLIEMVLIPMAWERPTMIFDGEVVYPTHRVTIAAREAEPFRPRVFALLKQMGTMARPVPSPSQSACRFCEVPASECAERFQETAAPVVSTLEF